MKDETGGVTPFERIPLLALYGLTVFPEMSVSFDVEKPASVAALDAAVEGDGRVFIVSRKGLYSDARETRSLFKIGVVCRVRQYLRTQNGGMRVMVDGLERATLLSLEAEGECSWATVLVREREETALDPRAEALMRGALALYEEYLKYIGSSVPETILALSEHRDPGYVADYIAQNGTFPQETKQRILEVLDPVKRLDAVMEVLRHELEVISVEHDISQKLRERMARQGRENILREQLQIIEAELGEGGSELDDYHDRILALRLEDEVEEKLLKEVEKLSHQAYGSAEGSVIRSYLDAVLELPWHKSTRERLDIAAARRVLDRDHFGLEKVKERILEYLAVRCVAPDMKGAILCLVGPPGVGKTSVAISIASAMNRKLARMSLGGVHDEADIRGHRKTYIGAMPGRIMAAVTQAKSNNPLLLLDEIDKLGSDYKGDPASALLEALDPEQNVSFRDHYLEVPFDLSNVMFITTANTTETIPRPLLDRMEVIELPSYTDEEKVRIAADHLLPKQRKKHGLTARTLKIGEDVLRDVIAGYTRESGVRQLERRIAALCRKADMVLASGEAKSLTVTSEKLEGLLGPRKYKPEKISGRDSVGVVNGLAWTETGGEILEVEALALEGTGKIELTGNLGDVMRESAHAAVSFIRSRCDRLGIDREFYKNKDIHIHFPEGAVPKDGPSAGIAITCAVISALTGAPARRDVAMTGEITLTGRVLPIGGLREKTMAALRFGVRTCIIPKDNEPDLEEIDQTVRRGLSFVTAERLDDILDVALVLPESAKPEAACERPRTSKRPQEAPGARCEV